MTYYSDLPDEAFTETERAAGVPGIYRSAGREPKTAPDAEISSNVDAEEFAELLVEGVCRGGLDVELENPSIPVYAHIVGDALDNWPDEPMVGTYLRVEHDLTVPVSFLIAILRARDLPLIADWRWWAWDPVDLTLKNDQPDTDSRWHRARALKPEALMDPRQLQVLQLLDRARLSTDHGKKPVLLERNALSDAMLSNEVPFVAPRSIPADAFENYALGYYNAAGQPATLSLAEVTELGYPVCTRSCVYYLHKGTLVPTLNRAKLLASAFKMAVQYNPNAFQWYTVRQSGTLFHSAIERADSPRDPAAKLPSPHYSSENDAQHYFFRTDEAEDALKTARFLYDLAEKYGSVYLTIGGHPLDVELVTTPELYRYAVSTLYKHGYSIRYGYGDGRAQAEKGLCWEIEVPF